MEKKINGKKITIIHYLNTKLKPFIIESENYYSVYVKVIFNGENFLFKSSFIHWSVSEKKFDEIYYGDLIEKEANVIIKIAEMTNKENNFERKKFYNHIKHYAVEIKDILLQRILRPFYTYVIMPKSEINERILLMELTKDFFDFDAEQQMRLSDFIFLNANDDFKKFLFTKYSEQEANEKISLFKKQINLFLNKRVVVKKKSSD